MATDFGRAHMVSFLDKGMPASLQPIPIEQLGAQGWNLLRGDLPLPAAILKQSALAHNSDWMRRFLDATGTHIAPHGKTTMSPELFDLQLRDGAWAITVATSHQLQVVQKLGYKRIVMANQLVGAQSVQFILEALQQDPELDFYSLVDSIEVVAGLADVARRMCIGRPLKVLLEGGYLGGRTGCRSLAEALQVARAVKANSPFLALAGVEGFEGLIKSPTAASTEQKVRCFLAYLVDIARNCAHEELFEADPVILSAGGSHYYDLACQAFADLDIGMPLLKLVRSGCYLTHDSSLYTASHELFRKRNPDTEKLGPGLQPAIEVWAYVQSKPEAGVLFATMGKRDVTASPLPTPLYWFRPDGRSTKPNVMPGAHAVTELNDQHAKLTVPADTPLAIGDMVGFGIGHPCLTFDKWRVIPVVNDDYDVISAIHTYF